MIHEGGHEALKKFLDRLKGNIEEATLPQTGPVSLFLVSTSELDRPRWTTFFGVNFGFHLRGYHLFMELRLRIVRVLFTETRVSASLLPWRTAMAPRANMYYDLHA